MVDKIILAKLKASFKIDQINLFYAILGVFASYLWIEQYILQFIILRNLDYIGLADFVMAFNLKNFYLIVFVFIKLIELAFIVVLKLNRKNIVSHLIDMGLFVIFYFVFNMVKYHMICFIVYGIFVFVSIIKYQKVKKDKYYNSVVKAIFE